MIYRTEHPKPQFMRESWQNLNGEWEFEFDFGVSGVSRGLFKEDSSFSRTINVPFCPESKLSGIEYTDFVNSVWYKREFDITAEQLQGDILLHFGAVDYEAVVYINGAECGRHKGGYVSFAIDITKFVRIGKNTVTVNALDDTRSRSIPSGKQSMRYESYGCSYTRTTGIWQTVWLEFVPKARIIKAKYACDIESGTFFINAQLKGEGKFKVQAFFESRFMGEGEVYSYGGSAKLSVKLLEKHLWEVGKGGLYDLVLTYGEDKVNSYFGLRSLRLDGYKFLINEKSVFQRLVLDQGFYPDGLYTAPSDGELKADIERSVAMGFNGARLHEKVFEERFLYHADKMGYIVWGEYPNWGLDVSYADSIYGILPEWIEEVERDINHPSIVGWCPFNETWDENGRKQFDGVLSLVYKATKAIDPSRPCIDTSGNYHVETDIFDVHDYDQNVEHFRKTYTDFANGVIDNSREKGQPWFANRQTYTYGTPMFVSEYGGIRWTEDEKGWGYGNAPETEEEFLSRLEGLTDVLLENPLMFGYCYTQLTDIEQEQNGLYTYDRKPKFQPEVINRIINKKAVSDR